jgi:hypothetical protein
LKFGLSFKSATSGFFNRRAVTSAVDRATRRVLSRFGAFVRTTARSSIRRRKSVSKPGRPPTSWTGLLKKFLFFSFDRERRSVVIGPVRLNSSDGEAPGLLERGGAATREDRRGKRHRVNYASRPYMGPAFEKEQPKLPEMWRDSIR